MGREKRNRIDVAADGTLSPTGAAAKSEADTLCGLLEQAAAKPVAVHTQDRDPTNREAWKRERAQALGHIRH